MENVQIARQGDKLVLTVDLKAAGKKSKNPKTNNIVIASTGGNKFLADAGVFVGVNVYKPGN